MFTGFSKSPTRLAHEPLGRCSHAQEARKGFSGVDGIQGTKVQGRVWVEA